MLKTKAKRNIQNAKEICYIAIKGLGSSKIHGKRLQRLQRLEVTYLSSTEFSISSTGF